MGFIKESNINNQVDLTAYLTQEARKNILDGDREDFQISYFSLSDSDTNYFTSKEIVNSKNNTLPSGMIPDITGDYTGVIKSIAGGTLNPKYFLSGSTTNKVGIPGTSGVIGNEILTVGFTNRPITEQTFIDVYPTLTNVSKSFRYSMQTGLIPLSIPEANTLKNVKYSLSISDIRILNSNGTPADATLLLNQDIKKLIENSLYFYDINRNTRSKNIIIENSSNTTSEVRLDFPIRDSRFTNTYPNIPSTNSLNSIRFTAKINISSLSFLTVSLNTAEFLFSVSNPLINQVFGQGNVPQISLSTNARVSINNLILPEPVTLSNIIALKEIEKNEDGTLGFQKTQTRQGTTIVNSSDLKFTKINLDNILNPNANLAMSFNIPITTSQITSYLSRFNNTSLQSVIQPTANTSTYNNQFILVEIPQNKYGEIIDGKTIELNIPVKSASTVANYTLYSTYFRSNTQPNTLNYNTLLSDPNSLSSYFSDVIPSLNNDNNSNVSYLFSNEVSKPISTELVLGNSLFSASTNIASSPYSIRLSSPLNSGNLVQLRIKFNSASSREDDILCILANNNNFVIENLQIENRNFDSPDPQDQGGISFNGYYLNIPTISNDLILNIRITNNGFSTLPITIINLGGDIYDSGTYNFTFTMNLLSSVTSETSWNKFTNVNKFSTNSLNNTGNKKWAKYDGGLLDKPIGIVYLDKGFLLITDPTIVNNFNYTGATSSGYDNIVSGTTYSGTSDFTRVYFTNTNAANINFDSITTEYTQNILCLALNNEFITSTNPTYQLAYQDENVKPLYFTQINLHNKNGKIIGIAKTSEPIKRTLSSVNIFNIKLKL